MGVYTINNTRGTVVYTINVGTTTGNAFPITIPGTGISDYGEMIGENLYQMLEHFADDIPPVNPVEGMIWYNSDTKVPHYYNGSAMVPFGTAGSSASVAFTMLPSSKQINFTSIGSTAIFQGDGTTNRFLPTSVVLVPTVGQAVTVSTYPTFNLYVSSSEDVMENTMVDSPSSTKFFSYIINGSTRYITASEQLFLEVTTAASGGTLFYDAYVFGFTVF